MEKRILGKVSIDTATQMAVIGTVDKHGKTVRSYSQVVPSDKLMIKKLCRYIERGGPKTEFYKKQLRELENDTEHNPQG